MISRRNVLQIIGGGTILAAGSVAGFALTRRPDDALRPWQLAGQYKDDRKNILSWAILAPNPHNRQPWLIDLSEPDSVTVFRDKKRDLPATDPFDRQLTIGMGCFLELFDIAARSLGYTPDTRLFPAGEDGPIAHIKLIKGANPDPLFAHIPARRSCKEPFSDQPVSPHQDITALAAFYNDSDTVSWLRDLTWNAFFVEVTTYRTMKESVDLFRLGKSEINANPDGIDIGGPFMEGLMLMGGLTREGQLDPESTEFQMGLDGFRPVFSSSPAFVTINSPGNTRQDQIKAGRRWMRLNLTTTKLGLSLHPISQALQEYAEMTPYYNAIHERLAKPGETIQMLGRIGYGPEIAPAPRWPIEKKILDG